MEQQKIELSKFMRNLAIFSRAFTVSVIAQVVFVSLVYLYVYPVYGYFFENEHDISFTLYANYDYAGGHELPGPLISLLILIFYELVVFCYTTRVLWRVSASKAAKVGLFVGLVLINVAVFCLSFYYGCQVGDCLDPGFI